MMMNAAFGGDEGGRLAARATARLLLAAVASSEPREACSVSRAALWAHAGREPGSPIDFAVERALRTDPQVAGAYRRLLSLRSTAWSEYAAAAHDGGPARRRVGDYMLDLVEEDGAPPTLVIDCSAASGPAPTMIEAIAVEGVVRLDLPEPVDGYVIVDLPRDDGERDLMRLLLANPLAGVYLL